MSFTDHSNRHLDLTVTDEGLPLAIRFLARMDIWRDVRGEDPFTRHDDPLCLAYRMAPDGRGVYLQLITQNDDMDEGDWTKLPAGLRAGTLANRIRKLLKQAPPDPDFDGLTGPGWRILNPMDAAWADREPSYEPEDFELSLAYIEPFSCQYAK